MITTVLTDSPHSSSVPYSGIVDTVTSLRLVPLLMAQVHLVFDGAPVPNKTAGFHWKCKLAADAEAYSAYKAAARQAIARLPSLLAPKSLTTFELPARACLSGAVRAGVVNATTPFVAVIQNDLPLRRFLDLPSLLELMTKHPQVQKVSFSAGYNGCYMRAAFTVCRGHRHLPVPPASNASQVNYDIPLTPVMFWFDGNHIASASHYRRVYSAVPDGVFMESLLFCKPWLNHSAWGTYLLGDNKDGRYSSHTNARNQSFKSNPCMIA